MPAPTIERPLRVGYVPLTDAAPLLLADALGLFARHGVPVVLSAEAGWAALRDKLAFGALHAAHLLGPLAIALAAGAGGLRRRLTITTGLARNGNTIVLSPALAAAIGPFAPPLDPRRFAEALHARAEEGLPPPTLAVVFPFSSHNYLLRHWLAAGGLDPDHDVRLVVVPPPRVARALTEGAIEGFCAGEPWGSQAVVTGAGRFVLATGDIWRDHPEKVLAFGESIAERDEEAVLSVTAAVIEAAAWLEDPANRPSAARILQERAFSELPLSTITAALEGRVAAAPGFSPQPIAAPMRFLAASRPRREEAAAWFSAMRRWGHAAAADAEALAPWRPDLWDRAAARFSPRPVTGRASPSPLLQMPLESDA
ncbi:CmpA/NrtA family ABC transporter substrate-binding protein [Neoroseomonas soli]|uniref:ABC transporter substrate-binding protein n=1 Tax=Neoroseomonas soli TaxID=1081025 RepID=A0A9X9WYN8_9PROT|nr:CmpA/NrtA family ABC transporter substrate-binding protein [Neoroseomonas soli]MBR0672267.1 ABC transporter substrate-binding protein [Neoroseomonas soli]